MNEIIKRVEDILAKGGNFKVIAPEYSDTGNYVYGKILSIINNRLRIYLNKDTKHCVILHPFSGECFDALHKTYSRKNLENYSLLTDDDNLFCLENMSQYGHSEISIDEIIWCVETYCNKYGSHNNIYIRDRLQTFKDFCAAHHLERKLSHLRPALAELDIREKSKYIISEVENILKNKKYCFRGKVFDNPNDFSDIAYVYTNGGCYVYAKIISILISRARIYIDKGYGHCILKIDDEFFDSEGRYENDISGFRRFTRGGDDDLYCLEEYGWTDDSYNEICDAVSKYLWKHPAIPMTWEKYEIFEKLL